MYLISMVKIMTELYNQKFSRGLVEFAFIYKKCFLLISHLSFLILEIIFLFTSQHKPGSSLQMI